MKDLIAISCEPSVKVIPLILSVNSLRLVRSLRPPLVPLKIQPSPNQIPRKYANSLSISICDGMKCLCSCSLPSLLRMVANLTREPSALYTALNLEDPRTNIPFSSKISVSFMETVHSGSSSKLGICIQSPILRYETSLNCGLCCHFNCSSDIDINL